MSEIQETSSSEVLSSDEMKGTGKSVYESTKDRFRKLYDEFDSVVVSFSGGKDSTAMLNCAIEVAEETGNLPVHALFFDEEIIWKRTRDLVYRFKESDKVNVIWSCIPIAIRNAASFERPYIYAYNPEFRDEWVFDPPEDAIHYVDGFEKGMGHHNTAPYILRAKDFGQVAECVGVRANESLQRYITVARRRKHSWISKSPSGPDNNVTTCRPVYDWDAEDIWAITEREGWDYNEIYDIMDRYGVTYENARVCNLSNENVIGKVEQFPHFEPETWERMCNRVPGLATYSRYGGTIMYRKPSDSEKHFKPEGRSWEEYCFDLAYRYEPEFQSKMLNRIKRTLKHHERCISEPRPLPEEEPDPESDVCWKDLARLIHKGDHKERFFMTFLQGNIDD